MRGLAAAFEELGWHSRLELLRPAASVPRRTVALLRETAAAPPPGQGLVLLRSHWSLPVVTPQLRRLRAQGHAVVIDVPTPTAAGVREIRGAPRPGWAKAARLTIETVWTPLAWPAADLVVQYAEDSAPWRSLAAERRLTLTNGVDIAARAVNAHWVVHAGLTFVCAGALGPWHGLDRLLQGMAAVPGDDSRLLVVGDGPELPRLRSEAAALGLADRVSFMASAGGADFDRVMARADVGVASLGEHRRGGAALSPLKTRDYLARGMPVLFAGDDPDLRGDLPFTFRLADDDSPVDVPQVRRWLQALRDRARAQLPRDNGPAGPQAIRAFATAHLQWRTRVEAILAALQR